MGMMDAYNDARDYDAMRRPLHWAARWGDMQELRALLQAGAIDVNLADSAYGATALHWAAQNGHAAAVEALLHAGAAVDPAATGSLIQAGLDVEPGSWKARGRTPLLEAAMGGYTTIVQLLLSAGAAVDWRNEHGATALYGAACRGWTRVVEALVRARADVDQGIALLANPNVNGATPLYIAALNGHAVTVRVLVRAGADLDPAIEYAQQGGHTTVVELLRATLDSTTKETFRPPPNTCGTGVVIRWIPPNDSGGERGGGYGFIAPDSGHTGGRDLFCHISDILDAHRDPVEGDRVEFVKVYDEEKGLYRAEQVRRISLDFLAAADRRTADSLAGALGQGGQDAIV